MLTKLLLASTLFAAACLDAPIDEPELMHPFDPDAVVDLETALDGELVCPFVDTEGPCAVACDPVALREWIQPGTCATFLCHVANGETHPAGGCRFE